MFSVSITLLDLIYVLVGYLVLRTIYCSFYNFRFEKFSKNLTNTIIKKNLHLHQKLWKNRAELEVDLFWLNRIECSDIFDINWHVYENDTKLTAINFNWKKKKSKWDFIFLYRSERGTYTLNKEEIRDKNIERLISSE